jgi:hypothetical protein
LISRFLASTVHADHLGDIRESVERLARLAEIPVPTEMTDEGSIDFPDTENSLWGPWP